MSEQEPSVHGHPDDTTYTWSVIVKPAGTQKINAFWMAHICDDTTQNIASVNADGITLLNTSIYSYSGHDDGWTLFYMDSNNNVWVYKDYQAGIDSGSYNAPDYNGSLTIMVDPSANAATLEFSYMDGSKSKTEKYTLERFVSWTSIS